MSKSIFKSSKMLKSFEIGNKGMANVKGGINYDTTEAYTISGSTSCSVSCPDYKRDTSNGVYEK